MWRVGDEVKIVVDSDWAGCSQTRKSTNGGCIMVGDVCLKAWSTTQRVVALSSGEAEYYAAIKGASESLGFLAGCADLGIWTNGAVSLRVLTDSTACKGICQRTGLRRDPTHRCCNPLASGLGARRQNSDVQNPRKGEPR